MDEEKAQWNKIEALQAFINPEIYTKMKENEGQEELVARLEKLEKKQLVGIEYRNKIRKERMEKKQQEINDVPTIA
jgi:hypothetical protein